MSKKNKKKGRTQKGGGKPKKKQSKAAEQPPPQESKSPKAANKDTDWTVLGLVNLTNTCYFNSALQLLLSSCFLQNVVAGPIVQNSAPKSSLTAALCELYDTSQSAVKGSQFKPNKILNVVRGFAPSFKSRGQHDAHELLITLLHHLVEEARSDGQDNWMDAHFDGKLVSTISCNTCQCIKSKEEAFLVLSVSAVKDGKVVEETVKSDTVDSFPLASGDVTVASSTETIELPDIVERDDPESLRRMNPSVDTSLPSMHAFEEDGMDGLQDLFSVPGEIEDYADSAEELSDGIRVLSLSDSLTETLNGNASNETADSAASLYWNADAKDDWLRTKIKKGKGKKGKKHKKQNRFEGLQLSDEEQESAIDVDRFSTIDACLDHFFAPEMVTWRCSKAYPEKRVTFNTTPEIFVLPPLRETRSGNWRRCPSDEDRSETTSDEETKNDDASPSPEEAMRMGPTPGLKSCLRSRTPVERSSVPPSNSVKRYQIWKAPKILCVHFKRFEAVHRRGITKLQHHIRFESVLDIEPFMDPKSPHQLVPKYELRAVVCHGGSVNFGHYTAFVSRVSGDSIQWYDVSDTVVRKTSIAAVLNCQAYILLYESKETTNDAS